MGLIEHAEQELIKAGYNVKGRRRDIKSDKDYANMCGKAAFELIKVFAKQGHSGMSAKFTLQLFNALARWEALTELTANPDEWVDISGACGEKTWQSNRDSSCFTHDMKMYYDIDDPDNNIYEKDEDGKLTGYMTLKPRSERKMVEIKPYKEVVNV